MLTVSRASSRRRPIEQLEQQLVAVYSHVSLTPRTSAARDVIRLQRLGRINDLPELIEAYRYVVAGHEGRPWSEISAAMLACRQRLGFWE